MKNRLLLFFSIAFALTACRQDPPVYPDGVLPGKGGSGNTGDGDYQPLTKGSYWIYGAMVEGGESTTKTTLTGNTKEIDKRVFYEAVSQVSNYNREQFAYYYKNDHIYIAKGLPLGSGENVELEYLDDSAPVGQTWTRKIDIAGIETTIVGKITEKNINKIVNGTPYKNVIHTTLEVTSNSSGDLQSVITYDFFIAKGIGVILVESSVDLMGIKITHASYLKQYEIK